MKLSFVIFYCILFCFAFGQNKYGYNRFLENNSKTKPYTINELYYSLLPNDTLGNFNPIAPLHFLHKYADSAKVVFGKKGYNEQLGTSLTFLGDYENASKFFNIAYENNPLEKIKVTNFKVVNNFEKVLLQKAKQAKFVFINEAHHIPEHRLYTTSLLQKLYNVGYKYFALEALSNYNNIDAIKNINTSIGLYTNEPFFADMVRQALHIGYTLIPYEDYNNAKSSSARDSFQTENILQFIKNDSNAKVLIHAGYGHICEDTFRDYKPLAYQLKMKTNSNPLTIDQTSYVYTNGLKNKRYADSTFAKWCNAEEVFFTDKKNTFSDFLVYRKPLHHNQWKLRYGIRNKVELIIKKQYATNAFLVQLYDKAEWTNTKEKGTLLPLDQTYYFPNQKTTVYPIKKKQFVLVVRNCENEILYVE